MSGARKTYHLAWRCAQLGAQRQDTSITAIYYKYKELRVQYLRNNLRGHHLSGAKCTRPSQRNSNLAYKKNKFVPPKGLSAVRMITSFFSWCRLLQPRRLAVSVMVLVMADSFLAFMKILYVEQQGACAGPPNTPSATFPLLARSGQNTTLPKTVYTLLRCGCLEQVMKNWLLFVFGPLLAMDT